MADPATIFGSDQSPTNQAVVNTTTTQGDTLPESVALLVGEGRKYKTLEDLAKAHLHLDDFAETVKAENATLREAAKSVKTLDDVLKRLETPPTSGAQDPSAKTVQSGLSAIDVAAIVRNELTGMETARSQQANLLKADASMKALFGEKANEMFTKEASTPELKKALMALAAVSPDKFVALFHKGDSQSGTTDVNTSVNTSALDATKQSGRGADPNCKEFYDQLRKTKPTSYYSSAMQSQMNKAAQANPNQFFGRPLS